MNIAASASNAIIRIVLIMPANAPPMPKCDSNAPRPRPSNAPPRIPRHGLAGLGAGAPGAAGGARRVSGAVRLRRVARPLTLYALRLSTKGAAAAQPSGFGIGYDH